MQSSSKSESRFNPVLNFDTFKKYVVEDAFIPSIEEPEGAIARVNFLSGEVTYYNSDMELEMVQMHRSKSMMLASLLVAYNYNPHAFYKLANLHKIYTCITELLGLKRHGYHSLRTYKVGIMAEYPGVKAAIYDHNNMICPVHLKIKTLEEFRQECEWRKKAINVSI